MKNQIEAKKQVLDMLKNFLLGEDGKKFAPKDMHVEVMEIKPKKDLESVLDDASEDGMDEDESMKEAMMEAMMDGEEAEEEEEEKPSFRKFFDK